MSDEFPKSVQLSAVKTKAHIVTAASWDAFGYGESYEIGIRGIEGSNSFKLIQSGWNDRTVLVAAKGIGILLDAGMSPNEISDMFS